jgi:hypothetical protein
MTNHAPRQPDCESNQNGPRSTTRRIREVYARSSLVLKNSEGFVGSLDNVHDQFVANNRTNPTRAGVQ